MKDIHEESIRLDNQNQAQILFGVRDKNIKALRQIFKVDIFAKQGSLKIRGASQTEVDAVHQIIKHLLAKIRKYGSLSSRELDEIIEHYGKLPSRAGQDAQRNGKETKEEDAPPPKTSGKIFPRTEGQSRYVKAIEDNDIVFAVGPAGTGKTFLAVAAAVDGLRIGRWKKIVLVRPAVEAGESLGFLPGDYQQKVNPYLAPLLDSMRNLMGERQVERLTENGVIEVAPLAYMRGRTLDSAFIILDEAQNTTVKQMKMFLTRMGNSSTIVVTGDITQIDLPQDKLSGLVHAERILGNIKGIEFIYLGQGDIVRHPLVQEIVEAYEKRRTQKRLNFQTRGGAPDTEKLRNPADDEEFLPPKGGEEEE